MTRAFIALELNQDQQRHLTDVIRQVALAVPHTRLVDSSSTHLTLAFLGELNAEQLAQAIDAAEYTAQQCTSFRYRLDGVGIFSAPLVSPALSGWVSRNRLVPFSTYTAS